MYQEAATSCILIITGTRTAEPEPEPLGDFLDARVGTGVGTLPDPESASEHFKLARIPGVWSPIRSRKHRSQNMILPGTGFGDAGKFLSKLESEPVQKCFPGSVYETEPEPSKIPPTLHRCMGNHHTILGWDSVTLIHPLSFSFRHFHSDLDVLDTVRAQTLTAHLTTRSPPMVSSRMILVACSLFFLFAYWYL